MKKKLGRGLNKGKKSQPRVVGSDTSSSLSLREPGFRHVLQRPDRADYVRGKVRAPGCVFCRALEQGVKLDTLVLAQRRGVMVVLNKFPYNTGHLLVLPTRHVGHLKDLSDSEFLELQLMLRHATLILEKEYGCAGLNLGLNHGAVAGAGLPDHLHWHVVPRWVGDTNFFPLIAETKVLPETVAQSYARLKPHFMEA